MLHVCVIVCKAIMTISKEPPGRKKAYEVFFNKTNKQFFIKLH